MHEANKIAVNLGEAFLATMREAVRKEIQSLICQDKKESDRLLTAGEAVRILAVSPDWLYRNARKLPFSRKLGPKMLRFSRLEIEKWITAKKISCRYRA